MATFIGSSEHLLDVEREARSQNANYASVFLVENESGNRRANVLTTAPNRQSAHPDVVTNAPA